MDFFDLFAKFQSMGTVGWIILAIAGIYLYNQWRSGKLDLAGTWTKILTLLGIRPTPATIQAIVDERIAASAPQFQSLVEHHVDSMFTTPTPGEAALNSVETLLDFFKNDPDGLAAAVKCGERIPHALNTPASPQIAASK